MEIFKKYKKSISNLSLILIYITNFLIRSQNHNWYSLNNNEIYTGLQKKYLIRFQLYSNEKKIAIIGAGIAGLTLANLIKNTQTMNLWFMKEKKVCLLKGYGIQLATNSIKILNK